MEIPENLWKELMQETLNGIIRLLNSSKILLDGGKGAISAGLYTYAIEEYGKLLLLKQCTPSNGKVTFDYYKIFKDKKHSNKFPTAFADLKSHAPECVVLSRVLFDPAIFDPAIFDCSGGMHADFLSRMAIFYCDLSQSGKSVREIPPIEKEMLKQ